MVGISSISSSIPDLATGKILDVGADWGNTGTDGVFHADTRYNLQTNDGANIYIRTSGPQQSNGDLYLRMIFETGATNYAWLNSIVAVGVLTPVANATTFFTLRIDGFYVSRSSLERAIELTLNR